MTTLKTTPTPVGGSPVQNVLLVKRFEFRAKDHCFQATSLPGHLIQMMIAGRVRQQCNGREYDLRPGSVIWYHEDEWVRGRVLQSPWSFYSVNFIAPCLPPPSFESRLFHPTDPSLRRRFETLLKLWKNTALSLTVREFRVQASLLEILASLDHSQQQSVRMDPRARLWWEIETRMRRHLDQPITMATMQQWVQRSPATIARSCLYALGVSPMKRLKNVRMSMARGLVRNSELTMKEIAERVGYGRLHEFSRYYHRHFGGPPSHDRIEIRKHV